MYAIFRKKEDIIWMDMKLSMVFYNLKKTLWCNVRDFCFQFHFKIDMLQSSFSLSQILLTLFMVYWVSQFKQYSVLHGKVTLEFLLYNESRNEF